MPRPSRGIFFTVMAGIPVPLGIGTIALAKRAGLARVIYSGEGKLDLG
jgi:hypothetical protein